MLTTLGRTRSTVSTVASRRKSASAACNEPTVSTASTTRQNQVPQFTFPIFIRSFDSFQHDTPLVASFNVSAKKHERHFLRRNARLCALDFARASPEKQWQGVRHFIQFL